MDTEEVFKDIPSYEGNYQASNKGRIKSLKHGRRRILKPSINVHGYLVCSLRKDNKTKVFQVHQLVAMTFLNHNPCGHKIVCDHINNVQTDNRLENLQLISNRENCSKDKKGGTSEYVGVCWDVSTNKWDSSIDINGKKNHLGYFTDEYEAHLAYQNALTCVNENRLEDIEIQVSIHSSNFSTALWYKSSRKWRVIIGAGKRRECLGVFTDMDEAIEVYEKELALRLDWTFKL